MHEDAVNLIKSYKTRCYFSTLPHFQRNRYFCDSGVRFFFLLLSASRSFETIGTHVTVDLLFNKTPTEKKDEQPREREKKDNDFVNVSMNQETRTEQQNDYNEYKQWTINTIYLTIIFKRLPTHFIITLFHKNIFFFIFIINFRTLFHYNV